MVSPLSCASSDFIAFMSESPSIPSTLFSITVGSSFSDPPTSTTLAGRSSGFKSVSLTFVSVPSVGGASSPFFFSPSSSSSIRPSGSFGSNPRLEGSPNSSTALKKSILANCIPPSTCFDALSASCLPWLKSNLGNVSKILWIIWPIPTKKSLTPSIYPVNTVITLWILLIKDWIDLRIFGNVFNNQPNNIIPKKFRTRPSNPFTLLLTTLPCAFAAPLTPPASNSSSLSLLLIFSLLFLKISASLLINLFLKTFDFLVCFTISPATDIDFLIPFPREPTESWIDFKPIEDFNTAFLLSLIDIIDQLLQDCIYSLPLQLKYLQNQKMVYLVWSEHLLFLMMLHLYHLCSYLDYLMECLLL